MRSLALLALAGLLALPEIGHAKVDLCVSISGIVVHAKGFKLPPKNTCKPFHGFTEIGDPVAGTACTNQAATIFRLGYTRNDASQTETGLCTINLPAMTGSCVWSLLATGTNTLSSAAGAGAIQPCLATPVP